MGKLGTSVAAILTVITMSGVLSVYPVSSVFASGTNVDTARSIPQNLVCVTPDRNTTEFGRIPGGNRKSATPSDAYMRDSTLREARLTLPGDMTGPFPGYAELMDPKAATFDALRAVLIPGMALIMLHVRERDTHVWAVKKDGKVSSALVPMGRARVTATIDKLRRSRQRHTTESGVYGLWPRVRFGDCRFPRW